jgi:AraC family transcriptional regulator
MSPSLDDVAPLLVHMHEQLDGDLSLGALAEHSGYSPFHFHRLFTEAVGETPKRHLDRLRLERAAYLAAVTDRRFIDIGLELGFSNPETFSRAFRRAFGSRPRDYRAAARRCQAERLLANRDFRGDGCALSEVRFVNLRPRRLLAVRRMGPYLDYSRPPFSAEDLYWARARVFAEARNYVHEAVAWAISYDDPTVTPDALQRLDACIPCDGEGDGEVRSLAFDGGRYAGAEHVGPHATLIQAYRHVADGVRRSAVFGLAPGPPVQIFRHIDPDPQRHRTEVYFPVIRA